jgi:cell division transport system ATP-binding protein
MIRFKRVHLTYPNGVRALENVNIEFKKGELCFITGPTGCGKSSLLKLIYLDEYPTRGRVLLFGKDTYDIPAHQAPYLRRKVGVVFQDFKLLPNKTVRENVSFALEVTGASRYEIERRTPQVLDQVGLLGKIDHFPAALSGGEIQRVAIARAIVNEPLILLADEPTGNLDPETSLGIITVLQRIQTRGTTVLIASHDIPTVERFAPRIVAMQDGGVVSDKAVTRTQAAPQPNEKG